METRIASDNRTNAVLPHQDCDMGVAVEVASKQSHLVDHFGQYLAMTRSLGQDGHAR